MKESVNIYISLCCNLEATKPPCVKPYTPPAPKNQKKGRKGKPAGKAEKKPELSTLGSWRCTGCGKSCKVSVMKRPPKDMHKEVAEAVTGEAANG